MLLFIVQLIRHKVRKVEFKYISCYCLSLFLDPLIHDFFEFKYISCYCLSLSAISVSFWRCDSNTSHVIVYPGPHPAKERTQKNSNTSHVIVYL